MAAVIRLKRKACDEPAEGLVIALKKPKCELSDKTEVLFKFASTLISEEESIRDHIQAALNKEKLNKLLKYRNPKDTSISENKVNKVRQRLQAEHKSANEKKKLDYLNNRRLILTEEFEDLEEDSFNKDAEVRKSFHLYDIIEENEEIKKQNDEMECTITCNNQPLVREKLGYVFDVYIADGHIDQTFIRETVSVRPCTLTSDDLYFGGSDSSEECYEDEDDSNDENNWRNDYPEEEDSPNSEKDSLDSDEESYNGENYDYREEMTKEFNDFYIGSCGEVCDSDYENSEVLKELKNEYDDDDDDEDEDYD